MSVVAQKTSFLLNAISLYNRNVHDKALANSELLEEAAILSPICVK